VSHLCLNAQSNNRRLVTQMLTILMAVKESQPKFGGAGLAWLLFSTAVIVVELGICSRLAQLQTTVHRLQHECTVELPSGDPGPWAELASAASMRLLLNPLGAQSLCSQTASQEQGKLTQLISDRAYGTSVCRSCLLPDWVAHRDSGSWPPAQGTSIRGEPYAHRRNNAASVHAGTAHTSIDLEFEGQEPLPSSQSSVQTDMEGIAAEDYQNPRGIHTQHDSTPTTAQNVATVDVPATVTREALPDAMPPHSLPDDRSSTGVESQSDLLEPQLADSAVGGRLHKSRDVNQTHQQQQPLSSPAHDLELGLLTPTVPPMPSHLDNDGDNDQSQRSSSPGRHGGAEQQQQHQFPQPGSDVQALDTALALGPSDMHPSHSSGAGGAAEEALRDSSQSLKSAATDLDDSGYGPPPSESCTGSCQDSISILADAERSHSSNFTPDHAPVGQAKNDSPGMEQLLDEHRITEVLLEEVEADLHAVGDWVHDDAGLPVALSAVAYHLAPGAEPFPSGASAMDLPIVEETRQQLDHAGQPGPASSAAASGEPEPDIGGGEGAEVDMKNVTASVASASASHLDLQHPVLNIEDGTTPTTSTGSEAGSEQLLPLAQGIHLELTTASWPDAHDSGPNAQHTSIHPDGVSSSEEETQPISKVKTDSASVHWDSLFMSAGGVAAVLALTVTAVGFAVRSRSGRSAGATSSATIDAPATRSQQHVKMDAVAQAAGSHSPLRTATLGSSALPAIPEGVWPWLPHKVYGMLLAHTCAPASV
jgi:hypothetical protein